MGVGTRPLLYGSAHHQFKYPDSAKLGYHLECPSKRVNLNTPMNNRG